MNSKYIEKINISDNSIYITFYNNNSKILVVEDSYICNRMVFEDFIDIQKIINKNKYRSNNKLKFIVIEYEKESFFDNYINKGSKNIYLYKGLTKVIEDNSYLIDLYYDENNILNIEISRKNLILPSISTIYIEDNLLNISFDKNLNIENYNNVKIALFNKDKIIKDYKVTNVSKKLFSYIINLMDLIDYEKAILHITLNIDGNIIDIILNEDLKLQPLQIQNYKYIKSISVQNCSISNILSIEIIDDLIINPLINSIKYNQEHLIIEGNINFNLDIFDKEEYSLKILLFNKKENKTIEDDLNIYKNKFEYKISKESLFYIKHISVDLWDMYIKISKNNEEILRKNIGLGNSVIVDNNMVLSKEISEYRDTSVITIKYNEKSIKLQIKGLITISDILSVYVRKEIIEVKYRTKENIETMLDLDEVVTNIIIDNIELKSFKTIKGGKKTYTCLYKIRNPINLVNNMLVKQITLISCVYEKEYKTYIKEINKQAICYSLFDRVKSSKKYKSLALKMYNKLFLKLPIKKNRVMFESFLGRNISGNPKYIYNYLVDKKLDKKYDLIWILNDTNCSIEGRCKKVKRKSIRYYYYMATSRYWIFNARQGDEIIKRIENIYLQTWHGTPLKRLGADMFNSSMADGLNIDEYKAKFKKNSSRWDYLLAQNQYSEDIFKRAFYFNKEILTYGYPANDILYKNNNKEDINKLKDKFKIPKDKKVLLYCPTWRDDKFFKKGNYKMSLELDLDKMKSELSKEYILILRLHYLISNSIDIQRFDGFVYDFSGPYDIQELYLVSDIQITDYSSTMFDYANLRRPEIFFTYDIDNYRDSLRGFYFELEDEAPGPVVKTTDEVIYWIKNIDEMIEKYRIKEEAFYNKYCYLDSAETSKNVVDLIFKNN